MDLLDLELLDCLWAMPWEICTTDFVLYEILRERQFDFVKSSRSRLRVLALTDEQVLQVVKFQYSMTNKGYFSLADCSILYVAKFLGLPLLMGGEKRKAFFVHGSVEVRDTLFLLGAMVKEKIIDVCVAASVLCKCVDNNNRLLDSEVKMLTGIRDDGEIKEGGRL